MCNYCEMYRQCYKVQGQGQLNERVGTDGPKLPLVHLGGCLPGLHLRCAAQSILLVVPCFKTVLLTGKSRPSGSLNLVSSIRGGKCQVLSQLLRWDSVFESSIPLLRVQHITSKCPALHVLGHRWCSSSWF